MSFQFFFGDAIREIHRFKFSKLGEEREIQDRLGSNYSLLKFPDPRALRDILGVEDLSNLQLNPFHKSSNRLSLIVSRGTRFFQG